MKMNTTISASLLLLVSVQVNAALITVTGSDDFNGVWDIDLLDGLYANNQLLLESQAWCAVVLRSHHRS